MILHRSAYNDRLNVRRTQERKYSACDSTVSICENYRQLRGWSGALSTTQHCLGTKSRMSLRSASTPTFHSAPTAVTAQPSCPRICELMFPQSQFHDTSNKSRMIAVKMERRVELRSKPSSKRYSRMRLADFHLDEHEDRTQRRHRVV